MRKIAIEDLIRLLGMVGIIGSLIFVSLEMQQSQSIAVASQQQERTAITVDMINAFYEVDVDFQSTYFDKDFNYQLLTEEIAYRNMVHKGWLLYANDFYQYKQGLMDELT
jgi:hypothetical protein